MRPPSSFFLFFFNDTATTEIYTLSLHDALPISRSGRRLLHRCPAQAAGHEYPFPHRRRVCLLSLRDRKSTRLNSSHSQISYAVFCLKKKRKTQCIGIGVRVNEGGDEARLGGDGE